MAAQLSELSSHSMHSQFKAFVGIDFGTDGSGIAYALPDGSAYIHNMWDDTDPSEKPKTSVLFDKDGSIIRVGSGAQNMYLGCTEDRGWRLFERFKMSLYEEPDKSALKTADSKMDYVDELKQEISPTNDESVKESSSKVFVAQLTYLKNQAFQFIETHLRKKVKGLRGNDATGYPDIQFFLTVPAIWSDRAKAQMVEWALKAGLISGNIPNQLRIVYEPDCASLSIQHAILRSVNNHNQIGEVMETEANPHHSKKKKKRNKLEKLIPMINLNVPFRTNDRYILLDVGGGTCDVACHQVMGPFAIAEVLHPSGGKWGATNIDQYFMQLLSKLFGEELMSIYQVHENQGRQSYLRFLQYFLSEAKLTYYQNYDTGKDIPHYHDIPMPGNFVNFVATQYATKYRMRSTADYGEMQDAINTLNEHIHRIAAGHNFRKMTELNEENNCDQKPVAAASTEPLINNPTDMMEGDLTNEDESESEDEDVNEKYKDRDWLIKIIEADEDDEEVKEDYMLSLHNDVWSELFDVVIDPIVEHCKNILNKAEMKDAKHVYRKDAILQQWQMDPLLDDRLRRKFHHRHPTKYIDRLSEKAHSS